MKITGVVAAEPMSTFRRPLPSAFAGTTGRHPHPLRAQGHLIPGLGQEGRAVGLYDSGDMWLRVVTAPRGFKVAPSGVAAARSLPTERLGQGGEEVQEFGDGVQVLFDGLWVQAPLPPVIVAVQIIGDSS